jgi:glycosyltransferase involved in cell wall biosynthesis
VPRAIYGTQTAIWSQKLKEMGHEVVLSSFWGLSGTPMEWAGMPVLPGFGGQYCSPSLQQHAKHVGPDLVITLGDVWVLDPAVTRELPVAHWLPSDCRPMSTADRQVVEASGPELIAMSKFGQERFKDAGFLAHYVPHGVDFGVWKPPEDKAALRERCGIPAGAYVIGVNAANNDAIRKAAPEMMLGFARFLKDHPDSVLALHTGVHCDGGQDLEAVAENLGITDRCMVADQYRYTAGLVSEQDLNDWYGCVDVLLASTYAEGFGLPIVEAMAAGTPVITTRCSSMEELNPDGIQVEGSPFWNGVHKAWWTRPSPGEIWRALEQAYEQRADVDPVKLRDSVAQYDVPAVAENFMRPVVDLLLEKMAARKAAAA